MVLGWVPRYLFVFMVLSKNRQSDNEKTPKCIRLNCLKATRSWPLKMTMINKMPMVATVIVMVKMMDRIVMVTMMIVMVTKMELQPILAGWCP